ncbi:hypothetical protein [Pseudomonas piscis]|uniref:hypothetical protein n=1 Tax=Pseudomonas piscis TaxID=2614538 RepID=UPI0021D5F33E|nr:hypothetical protein [Pseudomonas piscis]MCU7649745.1 hypothetical protein [Pseudomonas piscis]
MNFLRVPTRLALPGLLLLASTAVRAEGELMVMPASLKVYNNHEHSISLRNLGDAPLYLSVSVQKVQNPGLAPEIKVPVNELERPGLLANPDKITLGAGQSRKVSLRSLHEPQIEELYRVYVLPVRSLQIDNATTAKIAAPVSVSVGYGVLIRHMPKPANQRETWSHRCQEGGVLLENTGSVRLVFSDVRTADGTKLDRVAVFPGTPHFFPGKQLMFNLNEKPVILDCRQGSSPHTEK